MTLIDIPANTADQDTWTPEAVKTAYAEALIIIERTTPRQGPRAAQGGLRYTHTAEDIKGHHDRFDFRGQLMPRPTTKVKVRYSAEQIEWASFVLCGGSFHGSAKVEPWTSGIIAKSVTRESFEAWGRQVAGRRLGAEKLTMNEIAASVGLPPRTFHRYVQGAAEQIAKALNAARVEVV